MSKTEFNGIYIDLADISLIGKLVKGPAGWFAPIVWRATGSTINVKLADEKEAFSIIVGDEQLEEEKAAKENYARLVSEWKESGLLLAPLKGRGAERL